MQQLGSLLIVDLYDLLKRIPKKEIVFWIIRDQKILRIKMHFSSIAFSRCFCLAFGVDLGRRTQNFIEFGLVV